MRLKNDPVLYKEATKKILAQIDALHLTPEKHECAIRLVQLLRKSFTNAEIRKATFLANSTDNVWDFGYESGGFCRVASILFMYAMPDSEDWQLMALDNGAWKYEHHWLVHKPSGKILDLTYDQFISPVPYELGKPVAPELSLQDEAHVFAKKLGFNLMKLIGNKRQQSKKSYAQRYEDFTKATVKLAEKIHVANYSKTINAKYTLPEITVALRNIYKNPVYHTRFVGSKMEDNKWSSGFCAMASLLIYEMYGGADVWNLMAIRYNDWVVNGNPVSSVVFLQDKTTGINFGTTGEHFYPLSVPYNIGVPLDAGKLRTPNKEEFRNILIKELEQNRK